MGAHVASYILFVAPVPKGLNVCHKCDVKRCVNPEHLFLGTAKENANDAREKGRLATGDRSGSRVHPERIPRGDSHYARRQPERLARGESVNTAKLTPDKVREIRRLHSDGVSIRALAAAHSLAPISIRRIVQRLNWRHIE
jgi:hypothetical protein